MLITICGRKKGCFQNSPYQIQQKFDISNAPAVYKRIEEIRKNDSPGLNASCCRDENQVEEMNRLGLNVVAISLDNR